MLYTEKPKNFVADFSAVGCFVEVDGYILQLLRSKHCKVEPGKWGAPGGKMNFYEIPLDAILRKLKEETGIKIDSRLLRLINLFYVEYPSCKFEYYIFRLVLSYRPEIERSLEHTSEAWIKPEYANSLHLMQDEWECIKAIYCL